MLSPDHKQALESAFDLAIQEGASYSVDTNGNTTFYRYSTTYQRWEACRYFHATQQITGWQPVRYGKPNDAKAL